MSGVNEQVIEDGVFEEVDAPGVALVPLTPALRIAPKMSLLRPNPSFVAQLIATAEQVPQARRFRRASTADALSAYKAHRRKGADAGLALRQKI